MILLAGISILGMGTVLRTLRVVREVGGGTTFDRVKLVLVRRLGVHKDVVLPGSSLATDLQPNGFDRLEFRLALEEEFEVDIPQDEIDALVSVQEAVNAIDRRIAHEPQR